MCVEKQLVIVNCDVSSPPRQMYTVFLGVSSLFGVGVRSEAADGIGGCCMNYA